MTLWEPLTLPADVTGPTLVVSVQEDAESPWLLVVLQVRLCVIQPLPCPQSWAGSRCRSCLEIPPGSQCPGRMGEGWLFVPLIPSFLAGGGSLENIQLLTIQLMYTLAGACG